MCDKQAKAHGKATDREAANEIDSMTPGELDEEIEFLGVGEACWRILGVVLDKIESLR